MAGRGIFPAMVDKMSGAPGCFLKKPAHVFLVRGYVFLTYDTVLKNPN